MEKQIKIGTYQGKSYIDSEGRELFPFVMSTTELDRDNDIVDVSTLNIDNFLKNPILYYQHDGYIAPIGQWFNVRKEKNRLIGEAWFHELTDPLYNQPISATVKEYVVNGILKACSIGFYPGLCDVLPVVNNLITLPDGSKIAVDEAKAEQINNCWNRGACYLTNCELLECSIVSIPANQNALAIKKLTDMTKSENTFSIDEFKIEDNNIIIPEQVNKWLKQNAIALTPLNFETKAGREISQKNKEILKACHTEMKSAIEKIKAFIIEEIDDEGGEIEDAETEKSVSQMFNELLDEIRKPTAIGAPYEQPKTPSKNIVKSGKLLNKLLKEK